MTSKPEILALLRSEFDRWEEVLNGLSEEQITCSELHFRLVHQGYPRPFNGLADPFDRSIGSRPGQ